MHPQQSQPQLDIQTSSSQRDSAQQHLAKPAADSAPGQQPSPTPQAVHAKQAAPAQPSQQQPGPESLPSQRDSTWQNLLEPNAASAFALVPNSASQVAVAHRHEGLPSPDAEARSSQLPGTGNKQLRKRPDSISGPSPEVLAELGNALRAQSRARQMKHGGHSSGADSRSSLHQQPAADQNSGGFSFQPPCCKLHAVWVMSH